MTEDEAKTKWCPMARSIPAHSDAAGNRWLTNDDGSLSEFGGNNGCLGSACMTWRWDDYERTDGYCGLAGRPPSGPQLTSKP